MTTGPCMCGGCRQCCPSEACPACGRWIEDCRCDEEDEIDALLKRWEREDEDARRGEDR